MVFLEHFTDSEKVKIYYAGVETHCVNPKAISIMKEEGFNIFHHTSNNIDEYYNILFDYIITVCDNAKERCPFFHQKQLNCIIIPLIQQKQLGQMKKLQNSFEQ